MLALGQLEHHRGVVQPAVQRLEPGELGVEVGEPPSHLLRLLRVIPQARVARALTQALGLLMHGVEVEDSLHAGERRHQL